MTTPEITWGDPIDAANDGKPLPWLKEDERVYCIWSTKIHGGPYHVHCVSGWHEGFQIKLPADHPYYKAVARGFTYWPGGDSAPDDWDGGSVLLRNGDPDGYGDDWYHSNFSSDIIGYRKRTEAEEGNDDYVSVKRMTLAEYQRDDHGSCAWARRVGIIREETPLEQFEREFGALNHESRHAVEEFIEWQKNNG